jgi:anaerobic magnesium-protoporphyrin IX monomethyl ester cyclase
MKVLLVNPPYVGWLNDVKVEPIGLLYIASFLRQQGHQVALYDPYIGEEEDVFRDLMTIWKPQMVAIGVYTVNEQFCFDLAQLSKQLDPSVVVVAGGPHATFVPDRMLTKCSAIDAITHKESEEAVTAIAGNIERGLGLDGIPGISYRGSDGRVTTNPFRALQTPLDSLPFPAKDLLAKRYYASRHATGVITARGCAYKCDFCVSPAFFRGVRQRNLELVALELAQMKDERQIHHVHFYDDVFAYSLQKLKRVAELITPLELTYDCYVRVDNTTSEMLDVMHASGCVQVRFGVETGDFVHRSLHKGGRSVSFEKHVALVEQCRELGIETQASYILGFPDETREDMLGTIEFADRLNTDRVGFYKLTPYPGTKYWKLLDEDRIPLHNYTMFDNEVSVNAKVGSQEIFEILKGAYEHYYRRRDIPYDSPDTLRFLTSLPKLRY